MDSSEASRRLPREKKMAPTFFELLGWGDSEFAGPKSGLFICGRRVGMERGIEVSQNRPTLQPVLVPFIGVSIFRRC